MNHRRNCMVVFRLSEPELAALKAACAEKGARNLSEFTRSELLSLLHAQAEVHALEQKMEGVDRKLADLQSAVRRVATLLGETTTSQEIL